MSYTLTEYKNVDFFEVIDTEAKAYWLGFICADGNVSRDNRNILQINISEDDNSHLQKLGNIFGKETYTGKCFNKCRGKSYRYSILSCCQKTIRENLVNNGVYPDKTNRDSIEVFDNIPENLIHHFVRGYFDGDGCISSTITKNGKVNYCLSIAGSSNFLSRLKSIIINYTGASNTKTSHISGCDVIRWSGREQISKIFEWMYDDASIFMVRKKKIFDEYYKDTSIRGFSNFRGVVWHKSNNKWMASISHNKKRINLGYYDDEEEAAKAYDHAVIKYGKPLYKLNFKEAL